MMPAVAVRTTIELVRFEPETWRARGFLDALRRGALPSAEGGAFDVHETTAYTGGADWLILWGPGAPIRIAAMQAQLARGGHVIVFDLAYWQRDSKVRVSIDAAHPQAWVMRRDWPRGRLAGDIVPIGSCWKPHGPIVVAGIGRKAGVQYGAEVVRRWEIQMIDACRVRWPDRKILYRAKQPDATVPPGVAQAPAGPIDDVLMRSSLVITWHSNVAVDAIRLGIPVVCRDGAAAAVCPAELPVDPQPLPVQLRDRFLQNLAWFQWSNHEATRCLRFLAELLA